MLRGVAWCTLVTPLGRRRRQRRSIEPLVEIECVSVTDLQRHCVNLAFVRIWHSLSLFLSHSLSSSLTFSLSSCRNININTRRQQRRYVVVVVVVVVVAAPASTSLSSLCTLV
jgi:hypothetical protein